MDRILNLSNLLNLEPNRILNCYLFGSKVYIPNKKNFDNDYIIVYDNLDDSILKINDRNQVHDGNNEKSDGVWSKDKNHQASLYSVNEFQRLITDHKIHALECLFINQKMQLTVTSRPYKCLYFSHI